MQRGNHRSTPNPWRELGRLPHVTLRFGALPVGLLGWTCFETSTITLKVGLTQVERRCTLAHELEHVRRGPALNVHQAREERICDRAAARMLLPDVRLVGEALAWAGWSDWDEAAEELWVDVPTLRARLIGLHPAERAYLFRRLEEAEQAA